MSYRANYLDLHSLINSQFSTRIPFTMRLSRATLYAAQVFLSFFLMLVFMTYNVSNSIVMVFLVLRKYLGRLQAYLILATVVGAALGHFIFNSHMDIEGILAGTSGGGKGMACH